MKRTLVILLLMSVFLHSQGQTPVGSWSDHLVYNTAKSVAVGSKEVYASTGSSIIVYNKDFAELKKMSRVNGLSETGISTIAWSEENNALIIAYTSTNVDLVKNNNILNIPDISRKYIPGNKEIYRIRTNGKFAYLACSFGIVVLDIIKKEIYDTWKPGNGSDNTDVWDIAFGNGKIFAATGNGVYSADLSNPGLSFSGNWSLLNIMPNPNGKYTALVFSGNKLYANRSDPYSNGDTRFLERYIEEYIANFPIYRLEDIDVHTLVKQSKNFYGREMIACSCCLKVLTSARRNKRNFSRNLNYTCVRLDGCSTEECEPRQKNKPPP